MKKSLLFFGLALSLACFSETANAQQVREIPLAVTVVSPANGSTVANGAAYALTVNLANQSTSQNLIVGDTIFFHIVGTTPEGQFNGTVLTSAINAGANVNMTLAVGTNNNPGFDLPGEICVFFIGPAQTEVGGGWGNTLYDEDEPDCSEFTMAGALVGVNEESSAANWTIYPNPANEQVNIASDGISADAIITVHNSMGQRVFEEKGNSFRNTGAINSSSWNSGIYLVTITQNGVSRTQRVTVQH